ncbi:MAG: DUF5618 family protein [Planctomycetes bacterium]|nr:DUF5618 family protein [Planctomycetota bacterium]
MKAQRQRSPAPSGDAIRYLHNAREILKKAPREGRFYTDTKPVQEACSTAYLSVLKAIDEFLLSRELTPKELPKSVDSYRHLISKYCAMHNGKLSREFGYLYDTLHIAGYYRGLLHDVAELREIFNAAQQFIGKISK